MRRLFKHWYIGTCAVVRDLLQCFDMNDLGMINVLSVLVRLHTYSDWGNSNATLIVLRLIVCLIVAATGTAESHEPCTVLLRNKLLINANWRKVPLDSFS